ncbi:MAG TPA: hypothetical protein VLQ80_01615 [Candidatus Saccharimonadia bacterium]|nr:hypothetical protein [Candidatus Saccharimonadia bacterium]
MSEAPTEEQTFEFADLKAKFNGNYIFLEDVLDDVVYDLKEAQALRDWLVRVLP